MSDAETVEVPGIGADPLEGATPEETVGTANYEDAVAGEAAGAVESESEDELAEEVAESETPAEDAAEGAEGEAAEEAVEEADEPDEPKSFWSGLLWT